MTILFSYFALSLVHSYTLIVAATLPEARRSAVTTQMQKINSNQKTSADLFPINFGNLVVKHAIPFIKNTQERESEKDEEVKEEFQPCQISNKTYQHKEQIPRADPCEICVCVDSEMYCFWKLCPFFNLTNHTSSTPPSASTGKNQTVKQSNNDNNVTLRTNSTNIKRNKVETTDEKFSKILKDQRKYNALKKLEATLPTTLDSTVSKIQNSVTSTEKSTVCYVMGVMYKYGEVLPRDTGTCLECACSEGGRVSCSPKDCVSQPDLDYLSHNNNLDIFDLDTF